MPVSDPIANPYAGEFYFESGAAGVLLIHGFTGTPGHMRLLGEAFRDEGYTVLGIRLPGHGTTVGDMERSGWRDWLRASRDGCHRLMDRCGEVVAAGLSMGGTLSLLLACEMPLSGVVSIAAPMRIYDSRAPYTPVLRWFVRYKRHSAPVPGAPEPHPYAAGYPVTPLRVVPDLLRLMRMAESNLPGITCPLMVVQPLLDRTVKPESARIIYDGAVNAGPRELLCLENSPHMCALGPEFDRLRDNMSRFVKNCTHHGAKPAERSEQV